MMFDSCSENPLVIVGSDFFFTIIGNALPQKGGNVIRFYCKDGCSDNLIIKRGQILQMSEHDICCALNQLNCPDVTKSEAVGHRTVAFGTEAKRALDKFKYGVAYIEYFMDIFWVDSVK